MKNFTQSIFLILAISMIGIAPSQAQHVLDATIFRSDANKYFLFRGDEYARYDNFVGAFDAGFPKKINATDSDFSFVDPIFNQGLDAVVRITIGTIPWELFFSGSKLTFLNTTTNTYSATVEIGSNFQGLPADWKSEGIDAAFSYGGDLFLIKGGEIRNFDVSSGFNNPTQQFTTSIPGWTDNQIFTGIDAAYYDTGTNREVYIRGRAGWDLLFSGGFNTTPFEINDRFNPWPAAWSPFHQTVENGDENINAQIVDDMCANDNKFQIAVDAGAGVTLGSQVNVERVEIFVTHTWIGDLDISLTSPSGVTVDLTSDNGDDADNLGAEGMPLVFDMGATQAITDLPDGVSPQGTWTPEGDFANFEDGTNPTGLWTLNICDDAGGDVGTLQSFNIVLSGLPIAKCKTGVSFDLSAAGAATLAVADIDDGSTSWDGSAPTATSLNFTTLSCNNAPTSNVTLTVTGNNGLTSTCTSSITVNDVTPPSASCKQNISVDANQIINPALIDNGSTDNCSIVSMTVEPNQFSAAGNYNVTLKVTDVSGNTDECIGSVVVVASGIGELEGVSKFDVFPNPTSGTTTIDLEFTESDDYTLEVTNAIGQRIKSYQLTGRIFQETIDFSYMPEGMYQISIRTKDAIQSRRILVTK